MGRESTSMELTREKTWIVLPAYNAAETLHSTVSKIPNEFSGRIILVDDASSDSTIELASELGLWVFAHENNLGYGANQKTCYKAALEFGAEIVIMLHPDNQYDPRVVGIISDLIALDNADVILGNRIRNRKDALAGGMPVWKYFINRFTTLMENVLLGQTIGDFHSGLRGYSREVLQTIPFELNENGFGFDQQLLIQIAAFGFRTGEVPVPTNYAPGSSSINFPASLKYGLTTLRFILLYLMFKLGIVSPRIFRRQIL